MELLEGLRITVLGMGLVFFVLILLMFAMLILERLFRQRESQDETSPTPSPPGEGKDDEAIVAAVGAAIAQLLEEERQQGKGGTAGRALSPWRMAGRG